MTAIPKILRALNNTISNETRPSLLFHVKNCSEYLVFRRVSYISVFLVEVLTPNVDPSAGTGFA